MRSIIHFNGQCPHNSGWRADIRRAQLAGRVTGDFSGVSAAIAAAPRRLGPADQLGIDFLSVMTRWEADELSAEGACLFLQDAVARMVALQGRASEDAAEIQVALIEVNARRGDRSKAQRLLFRFLRDLERTPFSLIMWNIAYARVWHAFCDVEQALTHLHRAHRESLGERACLREVTATYLALMQARTYQYVQAKATLEAVGLLPLERMPAFWEPAQEQVRNEELAWHGWA